MKRLVLLALMLATAIPAQAQLFGGPNSVGGAILGGIAGGVIGHNNGRKTAEGIAIGAGAGLVLGAIADRNQSDRAYYGYSSGPSYYSSYGYGYGHAPYRHSYYGHHHGYRSYGYYGAPTYYHRPNYATSGAVLGGIAGGIIGHNNGRQTAEGIAIGAGAGLVLGAIADHNVRSRPVYAPAPVYVSPSTRYGYAPTVTYAQTESAPAPTQVTIINNNYYGNATPMSGANGLFGR
jgi:uncharacterized protein YcfJ